MDTLDAKPGASLTCCACGRPAARPALLGVDGDAFCSSDCEAEYIAYLAAELQRARQAFKSRTPQQKERVRSWNRWADAINATPPGLLCRSDALYRPLWGRKEITD